MTDHASADLRSYERATESAEARWDAVEAEVREYVRTFEGFCEAMGQWCPGTDPNDTGRIDRGRCGHDWPEMPHMRKAREERATAAARTMFNICTGTFSGPISTWLRDLIDQWVDGEVQRRIRERE